jgi:septal ring factor EnvC (AmiA/AmiB activator)
MTGVLVAVAVIGTWAMARGDDDPPVEQTIDRRLEIVGKTDGLLADKIEQREADTRSRVRALYKLTRSGRTPLWLDPERRRNFVRWRGAAARILHRDLRELELLYQERAVARRARARLERDRAAAAAAEPPAAGSLAPPVRGRVVAGFGRYRHDGSRATLVRRGVELASERGADVVAVAAGQVAFAGPLRGLGTAVVVDHGGYLSVIGRIGAAVVAAGDTVARGQPLGTARGGRIYLEIRLDLGAGGEPIDPAPLLDR